MEVPTSVAGAATPKNIIGLSVLLLGLAVVFGFLNGQKVRALHESERQAYVARDAAEDARRKTDAEATARKKAADDATAKAADVEAKAAAVQTELAQLQAERTDLQTKLQASQAEVASAQRKVEETGAKPDNPGAASPTELQAQLDDARHQLESAERENAFLSERIRGAEERSTQINEQRKQQRQAATFRPGVRGVVLAVNQAYNFVVLNLGGRQGIEPNSEMLVVRDGNVIGKLRISSVEPSTAIGDIVTSSLDRGVQVQPGDTVVYAGSNS